MLVTKCDICRKEVKDRKEVIFAGVYFNDNSFCMKCGKPVLNFLNKLKRNKNGKKKRK